MGSSPIARSISLDVRLRDTRHLAGRAPVQLMTHSQHLIAEVPAERQRDGIRWLVIEADCGGWFLSLHDEWPGPCKWHHWYHSREDILSDAERIWGVSPGSWRDAGAE